MQMGRGKRGVLRYCKCSISNLDGGYRIYYSLIYTEAYCILLYVHICFTVKKKKKELRSLRPRDAR